MQKYLASFSSIRNIKSAATTMLILPLITIVINFLMFNQYSSYSNSNIIINTLLVNIFILAFSAMAGSIVFDNQNQILDTVLFEAKNSLLYWLIKIFVVILSSILICLINLVLISLFTQIEYKIINLMFYTILSAIIGALFAICLTMPFIKNNNPYIVVNIISAYVYVFSGIFKPLEQYPPILAKIANIFPSKHIINEYNNNKPEVTIYIAILLFALSYLVILIYKRRA